MSRKPCFSLLSLSMIALLGAAAALGQYAPVSGTVESAASPGVPIADAVVEAYRLDIRWKSPPLKTNKKGEFTFAGLPLGTEFSLAVSAPNFAPTVYPGVKAGQDKLVIKLSPGDGRKLTEAEVKQLSSATTTGGGSQENAEEERQRAELEAKNKEIAERNERVKNADAIARKSNDEANAAYAAGNYDLAIQKYTEGINAVPDFIGSTPILWAGKMNALKQKGHRIYKEGAALTDFDQRRAKYAEAARLYDEGLAGLPAAVKVINSAEAAKDPAEQKKRDALKVTLYAIAVDTHRIRAAIDGTKADEAATVINEYIALEADPAKKLAAQMALGDIMRLAEHREEAVAAYKKVLEMNPASLDAEAYLGLGLVDLAWLKDNDKVLAQEGADHLQKFVAAAPDTHPLKQGAVEYLTILKTQNIVPVKAPPKRRQ